MGMTYASRGSLLIPHLVERGRGVSLPSTNTPSPVALLGCRRKAAQCSFSPMEAGGQEVAASVPGLHREPMPGLLAFGKAQVTTRS